MRLGEIRRPTLSSNVIHPPGPPIFVLTMKPAKFMHTQQKIGEQFMEQVRDASLYVCVGVHACMHMLSLLFFAIVSPLTI
jgi:hypothetical protein